MNSIKCWEQLRRMGIRVISTRWLPSPLLSAQGRSGPRQLHMEWEHLGFMNHKASTSDMAVSRR